MTWNPTQREVLGAKSMLANYRTFVGPVARTPEDLERVKYEDHGSYPIHCKPPFEFPPQRTDLLREVPASVRAPWDRTPLEAWTDGSGTTADKPAGVGVVMVRDGQVLAEASLPIGNGTNNVAELRAVGVALTIAFWMLGGRDRWLLVRSDSQIALGAATGKYTIKKNPVLVDLAAAVRTEVLRWTNLKFEHVRGHAGVEWNERADALAGRASGYKPIIAAPARRVASKPAADAGPLFARAR